MLILTADLNKKRNKILQRISDLLDRLISEYTPVFSPSAPPNHEPLPICTGEQYSTKCDALVLGQLVRYKASINLNGYQCPFSIEHIELSVPQALDPYPGHEVTCNIRPRIKEEVTTAINAAEGGLSLSDYTPNTKTPRRGWPKFSFGTDDM